MAKVCRGESIAVLVGREGKLIAKAAVVVVLLVVDSGCESACNIAANS